MPRRLYLPAASAQRAITLTSTGTDALRFFQVRVRAW